jgi:uncharacterized protein involved in type VI secretion and phage assembly
MTKQTSIFNMPLAYGRVLNVDHPEGLYAVQIQLHQISQTDDQDGVIWARVTAPFAGDGFGAVMLPDVGQEVIVGFIAGDQNYPIVLGAVYTGQVRPNDEPVDAGAVKRWSMTGSNGTHFIIDESTRSALTMETSGGVKIEVNDAGTKVVASNGSSSVTIDPAGVSIETGATVKVQASTVDVTASMVSVSAGISTFSGVVQCDALVTNTVIASTYTPGAGNVW